MIHLAYKDIRHTLGKFLVTAMGVGMLLGIVLIMIGVYRGMIIDAQVLLDDTGADLWIVQDGTMGPFAEASRIHEDLKNSLRVIDGIDRTAALTFQNLQLPYHKAHLRVVAVGYDPYVSPAPLDPTRLIAGRPLARDHYEMVVSEKLAIPVGTRITLGRNRYTVVGITHGTVSSGGDPLIYLSLKDAQELQFLYANPRIRNDRARGLHTANAHMVNAVIATLRPGYDPQHIAREIRRWKHLSVYTQRQQRDILTHNLIKMASKQIGMFTVILVIVSTIIIALIIYTMTLEKMKEIAIMKLIGIPNMTIIRMIGEETLLLGVVAFLFANLFAHAIYDSFPKRVVLERPDAWMLFVVVLVASVLASISGIRKVIQADPAAAIGG